MGKFQKNSHATYVLGYWSTLKNATNVTKLTATVASSNGIKIVQLVGLKIPSNQ